MKNIAVVTPVSHLPKIVKLLESKGNIYYKEDANKEEVRELLIDKNIDTIVCNPNKQGYIIDKSLLENTPVSLINSCSTGLNHIDLDYCKENNIEIQCHKDDKLLLYGLPSTAELAFGLMLSLLRKIPQGISHVKGYNWNYTEFIGTQIKGLTIGIVGCGRLGSMMYNYCKAFGATVLVYDPYVENKQITGRSHTSSKVEQLDDLFSFCDVISLHVHVTSETKKMIGTHLIHEIARPNPLYLVNTSRGDIVDENAIVTGIATGRLGGYATDVVTNEFGDLSKSPIIRAMADYDNILVTPHIGGMTYEGQTKAYEWSINKLENK